MLKTRDVLILAFFFITSLALADDSVTLTTYYPAPNGNYTNMNVSGTLTAGLVSATTLSAVGAISGASLTTTGNIISTGGNVGVGVAVPASKLDVLGTVNATGYEIGGTAGIIQTLNVRNSAGTGTCTITVNNGVITASTC